MDEMDEKRFEDARRRYPLGCIEVWIKDEQGGESLWHVTVVPFSRASRCLPTRR